MPCSESVVGLYRSVLHQACTLSKSWRDQNILKSHAYIARRNLEPLLRSPIVDEDLERWPTSPKLRRVERAKRHARQLSEANAGMHRSVQRAFWQAYARTGKLRRDALSLLSPPRSDDESQKRYPPKLRERSLHPLLQKLITTSATMRGTAAKPAHLSQLPPQYLPAPDDPMLVALGKKIGRRRSINAQQRWISDQMKKIILPLPEPMVKELEAKAMTEAAPVPRRWEGPLQEGRDGQWNRPRLQRRLYARLLESAPALLHESRPYSASTKSRNDPLELKQAMRAAIEAPTRYEILKSQHAIVKRGRRAAVASPPLSSQELEFLTSQGLLKNTR